MTGIDENRGAIILAGGQSRRMRRDKALLPIGDQTLIERSIGQLAGHFSEILISTQNPGLFDFLPFRVVLDEAEGSGPIMGLLSGLKAASYPVNFVIGGDIPDIDLTFLSELAARAAGYDIVVPRVGQDQYEPLFAFYHKNVIPHIEGLLNQGEKQIIKLFPLCRTAYVPFKNSGWYFNLNTPDDYRAYLEKIGLPNTPFLEKFFGLEICSHL